jgi:putative FmdB family regulatory protein
VPTYEYECNRCGPFEAEQKASEAPLVACPRMMRVAVRGGFAKEPCDGEVRRLIAGSTSFVLKGSRWAKDGY